MNVRLILGSVGKVGVVALKTIFYLAAAAVNPNAVTLFYLTKKNRHE